MCIILKNLKMGHLKLVLKAQALYTENLSQFNKKNQNIQKPFP